MAEFKTYERQSQAQSAPMADYMTPAQSLINTLQQFTNNRFKQAQDIANVNAAKAGQEAGSALDYQEKTAYTEADKAFNHAAQQAHQALIHTEIQTQTEKIRSEALDNLNPGSLKEFDAKFEGFSKGLMSQVSPDNQAYAKNLLGYYGATNQLHVASAVRGLNKQIVLANTLDFANKVGNQATNAAFQGDSISAAALFSDMDRKLQSALATGMISGAQYESQKQAARSDINVSHYLGQFQRHLQQGKGAEAYQKFVNEVHPDITKKGDNLGYLEADTIRSRMHTMLQTYKQEQALKYGSLNNQVKDFDAAASQPGIDENALKAKASNLVSQIYAAHPEDSYERRQLLGQVEFSFTKQNVLNEARWTSPAERENIANHLQAEEQKRGVELTSQEASNYTALINSVRAMDKQAKDDPAAYSFQHPAVQEAFEQLQQQIQGQQSLTGDQLQTGGLPKQNTQNADPYYSAIELQKHLGTDSKDISLMTKPEAASKVAELNNMEAQERMEKLASFIDSYPDKYQSIVMNDLKKAKLSIADIVSFTALKDQVSSSQAPYIYAAANSTIEELNKSVKEKDRTALRSNIMSKLLSYSNAVTAMPGDATDTLNSVYDATQKLALVYMQHGDSSSSAAQKAADTYINNKYNFGSVNGFNFMVPKAVDKSLVSDAGNALIQTLDKDNLLLPPNISSDQQNVMRRTDYLNELLSQGHYVMNTNGNGMILLDASGNKVRDSKGDIIGFEFADLTDSSSHIIKQLGLYNEKVNKAQAEVINFIQRKS